MMVPYLVWDHLLEKRLTAQHDTSIARAPLYLLSREEKYQKTQLQSPRNIAIGPDQHHLHLPVVEQHF